MASIGTQNYLRMIGGGYGGGGGTAQPYNVHAALLGEARGNLETRRYKDDFALRQRELDELLKERDRRFNLAQEGQDFSQRVTAEKMGVPLATLTGEGPKVARGGAGSYSPMSTEDLNRMNTALPMLEYLKPRSYEIDRGFRNPLFDPAMANLYKKLSAYLGV